MAFPNRAGMARMGPSYAGSGARASPDAIAAGHEAGVAATPGPDFDHEFGHRYMRFSFAGTGADILEGIERLSHWLK